MMRTVPSTKVRVSVHACDDAHGPVAPFSPRNENQPFVMAARSGVDLARARNSAEGGAAMPSARPSATSIDIASCAVSETVVVKTRSSVYELVVLRGNCGEVLVRGSSRFERPCPAFFVGSIRDDGALERHTIDIGLRMKFYFDHLASAAATECAATQ